MALDLAQIDGASKALREFRRAYDSWHDDSSQAAREAMCKAIPAAERAFSAVEQPLEYGIPGYERKGLINIIDVVSPAELRAMLALVESKLEHCATQMRETSQRKAPTVPPQVGAPTGRFHTRPASIGRSMRISSDRGSSKPGKIITDGSKGPGLVCAPPKAPSRSTKGSPEPGIERGEDIEKTSRRKTLDQIVISVIVGVIVGVILLALTPLGQSVGLW